VEVTGHASRGGAASNNFQLAREREQMVSTSLTGKGVSGSQLIHQVNGEQDNDNSDFSQRVDVHVLDVQTQVTSSHEAGHMFGLGDEYMYAGESSGDPLDPAYQKLIRATSLTPLTATWLELRRRLYAPRR